MTLNDTAEVQRIEIWDTIVPVTAILGVETVFAFFGNMLVIYVFLFHYKVCNFKYFVLSLACFDITSSVTTMPGEMVTQLKWYEFPDDGLCKAKSFFNAVTASGEALCLLTISLDRYRKVCRPFEWQIKPKIARILCIVIMLISVVVGIPVLFFRGTNKHDGYTSCDVDSEYTLVSTVFVYSYITFFTVTSLFLTGLYIFIMREMYQKRGKRRIRSVKKPKVSNFSAATHTNEEPGMACVQPHNSQAADSSSKCNDTRAVPVRMKDPQAVGVPKQTYAIPQTNEADEPAGSDSSEDDDISETGSQADYSESETSGLQSTAIETTQTSSEKVTKTADDGSAPTNGVHVSNRHIGPRRKTKRQSKGSMFWKRLRRKTLIMLILTMVFNVTILLYSLMFIFIIQSGILKGNFSDSSMAAYLFFFRLYFINHAINPVIYGALDPKFRQVFRALRSKLCTVCRRRQKAI